jgi:hypothetical protein
MCGDTINEDFRAGVDILTFDSRFAEVANATGGASGEIEVDVRYGRMRRTPI